MRDQLVHVSRHANVRAQQRSIPTEAVELVMRHGDIEGPAALGRHSLRLSHRAAGELLRIGTPVALVEKAATVVAILSASGEVVTLLRVAKNTTTRRRSRSRALGRRGYE